MTSKKAEKKVAPKGLAVKVKLDKVSKFGKDRLEVTVTLTQDGKEISQDTDFLVL